MGIIDINKYDLIVAHSYGCAIILIVLYHIKDDTNIVLFNPTYGNLKQFKFISRFIKLNTMLFSAQKKSDSRLIKILTKILSLLSVNKFCLIDNILINDIKSSNSVVSAVLFYELACSNWKIRNKNTYRNIIIVSSAKDRIVRKCNIEELVKDIGVSKLIELEKYRTYYYNRKSK